LILYSLGEAHPEKFKIIKPVNTDRLKKRRFIFMFSLLCISISVDDLLQFYSDLNFLYPNNISLSKHFANRPKTHH